MRNICSLVLANVVCSWLCYGQTSLYDSTMFYTVYKNTLMIEALIKQTGSAYEGALEHAKIGNHQAALAAWDENPLPRDVLPREDSARMMAYVAADARDYLIRAAEKHRLVMLNEAVYNQAHRIFAASLLPALRKQGFTHLAIEWLSPYDLDLAQRKYALKAGISGTYTDAPPAASLLKVALEEGFTLLPFPATTPCANGQSPEKCASQRERFCAETLAKVLVNDPAAKMLVLCTFGHVDERTTIPVRQLGSWMAELAKTDPLTVDQETMSPHSTPAAEDPFYTLFAEKVQAKRPSVLLRDGSPFVRETGYADVLVFHPRPRFTNQRPDYLLLGSDRKRWTLPPVAKMKANHHYLVMAYAQGTDPFFGVPDDIVEVSDITRKYDLCLRPGNYTVHIVGEDGALIQTLKAEIK